MRVYRDLNIDSVQPCVLALGCFDGVHIGHREVIGRAKSIALEHGLPLAVFTFEQPPRNFFSPASVPMISTTAEKLDILASIGTDICVCLPLNEQIFSTDAEDFINDIILGSLCASFVVCGYNYSFGKGAAGNTRLLSELCKKNGAALTVVPEKKVGALSASSSVIRALVSTGEVEMAARLLTRPFSISERVIDGQHLARTLGFPTVNMIPPENLLLPASGVYVSRICIDGTYRYGITNIGTRPTVSTDIMCAETHIFDFDGNLYGRHLTVEFLHFIRKETKFSDIDALASQVKRDIGIAREFICDYCHIT